MAQQLDQEAGGHVLGSRTQLQSAHLEVVGHKGGSGAPDIKEHEAQVDCMLEVVCCLWLGAPHLQTSQAAIW